ncbi:MAG: serine/threonine protein kinase [Alphaproteobacteria bacterium]|nr:serine/threonine protein kinase [Alphaproteobacteria bacterium]
MSDEVDPIGATIRTSARVAVHRSFVELVEEETDALELGRVLGRGGMATVTEGRQPALRRIVAVKHTDEASPDDDRDALVQEAWLTGALEHPNIVPIHDVRIVDGEPHVVMKHIEGVSWSNLIDRPVVVRLRFNTTDPLSWHIQTLLTVCNAVEYAHSRGILHLDLKPDNVMIGDFGEVWVVDWGIAVVMRPDNSFGLPVVETFPEPFGTPAYMAPEMARPGSRVTPATDVYLLAGILYRILTGKTPRTGKSAEEVLRRTFEPIPIDPDLPMADLLRRSLALDPDERPQDVKAFREGITAWLENRGALELSQRASLQLVDLVEKIGAEAPRTEIYNLFGACRFGFEEALRTWPDADLAIAGRREAIEVMARYELDAGDDRAAELLLEMLDEPPPELVERFRNVRATREKARATLSRIQEANDPRTAWGARALIAFTISAIYVATPIGTSLLGLPQGYLREIGIAGTTFTCTMVMFVLLNRRLVRSRLSRVLVVGMAMGPGMVVLMHIGCWLAGMDSQLAGTLELFVYCVIATVATLLAEYRMAPSALGFLVAYYLAMAMEGTTLLWMNLANLVLFINVLIVWLPAGFRNEMPEDVPLL